MSARKEYVKLWLSYETYFQSYTPEEIGNLVLAMIRYKDTGEAPVFQGNERFIWPAVQRDMDEASEAQEAAAEKHRECGRKGGRRREEALPAGAEKQNAPSITNLPPRTKDIDKGHSQGQGQGQETAREKFAAADRLFAQIISDVRQEAAERENAPFL